MRSRPLTICLVTASIALAPADALAAVSRPNLPRMEYLATDYRTGKPLSQVKITVPTVPDCVSAIWCYEGIFPEGKGEELADGSFVLHSAQNGMTADTVFTPLPNAVDVRVTITGTTEQLQRAARSGLNPCWQHYLSAAFGSGNTWRDGTYPEDFVPRCFIFTVRGLTRLNDTVRFAWVPDHTLAARQNNPPWVQNYISVTNAYNSGNTLGERSVSTDRPILPIIGVVSRDGKWLQAWAWPPDFGRLGQVWRDCLHPTPIIRLVPGSGHIETHSKIYFMENDANKLLAAYLADFGATMAPAISVEAEGSTLLVRSREVPYNVLKLSLPKAVGGVALPAAASLTWVKQPWGTYQAQTAADDKGSACYFWVHPTNAFLELAITVANGRQHLLSTTLEAEVDTRGAPAVTANEAAAVLLLEGGASQKSDAGTLRVGTQIAGVIPGAYRTARGRLYVGRGNNEQMQAKGKNAVAEWQRAQPYLVAPPAATR